MDTAGLQQSFSINPPREKIKFKEEIIPKVEYRGNATILYKDFGRLRPEDMIHDRPLLFNQAIDYSSRRGVLPLYSINRIVGRNPPEFGKLHGYVPRQGMSRTQKPSVANGRPITLPIHVPRSNINASQPSRIGIASTLVM